MTWGRGDSHIEQLYTSWFDVCHSVLTTEAYLMFLDSDKNLWKTQKHYMHVERHFKIHHKPQEHEISTTVHAALLHGQNIKTHFKNQWAVL